MQHHKTILKTILIYWHYQSIINSYNYTVCLLFIHGIQERKDNLVGRKSLRLDIDHHSVCSTFSCLFLINHSAWALKIFFLKIPDVNIVELNIKRKWEKMSWHKHNGLLRNGRERKKFQNLPDILYNCSFSTSTLQKSFWHNSSRGFYMYLRQ